ncbi:MAG: hypothetical protein NZ992_07910, partial [Candidatus Korarchaeum sp.]|nr:hypothetical protein [Candidatus Korarchaeum sp.]MDW8035421.1 hypothetical protein [Candidatus Korarchaeum sp.]
LTVMSTRATVLALASLLVLVGAYLYVSDMVSSARRIDVNLAGAELKVTSFEKVDIDFLLNITNPTGYEYEVELVKYDIYLQGIKVGNGSVDRVKLSPKSSTLKHTITELRYSELTSALISALISGRFEVNVTGYLKVRTPVFPVDLRFSEVRSFP